MSDIQVTLGTSNLNVSLGGAINVQFPVSQPANVEAWASSLGVYDSDESAALDGVAVGSYYITASNHIEAPGGIIKKRLT